MRLRVGLLALAAALLSAAPSAVAAPSDLDPSFGTGGLSLVPGGDRYDAQNAPLLQDDARIIVAGLLRNGSDRVFLDRLSASGSLDTTFAGDGDLHTGVTATAASRRVATALLPDDRVIVVGGSDGGGKLVAERYRPDGAPDTSFGNNGKLVVDLGGSYARPFNAVALADGSTRVAVANDGGGKVARMTVVKLSDKGLALDFGTGGIARVSFPAKPKAPATAFDVAVLGDGSTMVAGVVGEAGSAASDAAVARLTPAGALDPGFATGGTVVVDGSGTQTADHAAALLADATGSFTIAGPAGAGGFVARLSPTGALDGSFADGGVLRGGVAPDGASFVPADLAYDEGGRLVLTGSTTGAGDLSTTHWTVARLERTGAAPLDPTFAPGGRVLLDACANTGGHGPTGIATTSRGRLLVLGNCGATGTVGVVRLFGRVAVQGVALDVRARSEAAGHELVPLSAIDPTTVLGAVDHFAATTLGSGPMGSGPMGSGPMGSGPMGSGPMGSGPMGSGPMGSGPMGSGPMGSGPMGSGPMGSGPIAEQVLLSDIPLRNGQSWAELLAPYYPDGVPPLQTLTLADVYRLDPQLVDGLTYADVDATRTPLRFASLASIMLTRPIGFIDPPEGGWCAYLDGQPRSCGDGADPATTTLLELEFAGVDMRRFYAEPLRLSRAAGTDLGTGSQRATLAYLDLRQVLVSATPLGRVPAAELGDLLACHPACTGTLAEQQEAAPRSWTAATIGDLVARLPLPSLPDLTLGQLLAGMVHPGEIPYERADRRSLLDAALLRADDLQTYTVTATIDCAQAEGLELVPRLAGDARAIPGSATATVDGGAPVDLGPLRQTGGGPPAYDLAVACAGRSDVVALAARFDAEPGSTLGPASASVRVANRFGSGGAASDVAVDDSRDPGDAVDTALALGTDRIRHGWIAHKDDVDFYTFAAPAAGTKVSITLAHIPQGHDFDLHVFGPVADLENPTLHSGPMGSGPMGSGPLPDSLEDAVDVTLAEPDTVQDMPMGSGPMGSGPMGSGPMGSGSINRGNADEAVTFRVRRADAGKPITVRVTGYNGDSADAPYALRRSDLQPPPAPPCPARTGYSSAAPGAWPQTVPADTKALYLVNRQRLAALNSSAEADTVMDRLAAVAARTDGLVVPVESTPGVDVGGAYAAWDADPCHEGLANTVVSRINEAVDVLRRSGDGLEQLRSIVLVGPDAVMPQARLRDLTTLSNEDEYADDARFGADDDAVSGALRNGYMLTDDPYGDFNASTAFYVPDVALGRLVETAPEIAAQLQEFVDREGVIDPSDAVVYGYDLFDDGAIAQGQALGVDARVDDWDAAAAQAAINRPAAGFTAINAHYDSYRALPAAAFYSTGRPDFLFARDAQPQPGSLLFTMGCHAGLNISARVPAPTDAQRLRLGDWAQLVSQRGSLYTASTTFSYGDTETVAYTERLMTDAAAFLHSREVTAGQAFMYAKQHGLATVGVLDAYYVKSSQALTFYGLPMYRVTADGGTGASGMPPVGGAAAAGAASRTSDPVSFDLSGDRLQPTSGDRGTFWTALGQPPLVVQNHPVQPVVSKDVTSADGRARGYLIESLRTQDLPPSDPVIARPTVDLEAHEPEPGVQAPLFPASLASVTTQATPDGRRDRLIVAAGQYRRDHQRLFRQIGGRVMRSTAEDDRPLQIRRVDGAVNGESLTVRVEVDGGDALGGNVLYRTDADGGPDVTWRRADLAVVGDGVLATGARLTGTRVTEALVQVYDDAHNVSLSNYKVTGYSFEPVSQPPAGSGAPRVIVDPEPPATGYLSTSPAIGLDPGDSAGASFQYRIDGGPWQPFEPGSTVRLPEPADGEHLIEFRGSDGSSARRAVAVDRVGPTVTAEADRVANAGGWYDGPVTVTFTCADAVSGVATCPDAVTLSAEGAGQSASGTATDAAGNTGSGSLAGINIDLTDPTAGASIEGTRGEKGWYLDATARFTCADALSGIASCGPDHEFAEGAGRVAEGTAVDRAGRRRTVTAGPVDVDRTDPQTEITTPDGTVLFQGQTLKGRGSDTVDGSGLTLVTVTYTPTTILGRTTTVEAVPDCPQKTSCTWQAGLPPAGTYRVTAVGRDQAGRTGNATPRDLTISVSAG